MVQKLGGSDTQKCWGSLPPNFWPTLYLRKHDIECQSADSETVFIELNLAANKKMIVGVMYRHPTNIFNEFQDLLLQTLNKMDNEKYDYFLCGDFNIDILKHESKKIE